MDVFTIEDFLDESEVSKLLEFVDSEKENFHLHTRDSSAHIPYYDSSIQCRWFREKLNGMLTQIVTALNRPMFKAEPALFEATLSRNCLDTGKINRRHEIGFAYHFYTLPRQFTGGEMTYTDTRLDTVVTLLPKRNSINFYAANLVYQLTPTYGSDRYTIHGYLSKNCERLSRR